MDWTKNLTQSRKDAKKTTEAAGHLVGLRSKTSLGIMGEESINVRLNRR
jgi:hypothetical protein